MASSIKQMLDQVMGEVGHPIQDLYFGGTNHVITSIVNRSVANLSQQPYSKLIRQGTITMTTALAYALPDDYRYIIPDSMNAQDIQQDVVMPLNNKEWNYYKSQTSADGIRYKCRIYGGYFNFISVDAGQVINYEYVTKYAITNSAKLIPTKERPTSDDDYFLFDDNLLILDIVWRYGKTLGLEGWQVDKQIFDDYEKTYRGSEAGSSTLDFSGEGDGRVEPYYPLWQ